ncbi:unnamed protein product [Clavelina lepadiformis]|uniref:Uncharacterized protein n=1 Tax=Clavelina lepadiformis TaxID=159417 RepID=A0ABP0FJD7_CLALP
MERARQVISIVRVRSSTKRRPTIRNPENPNQLSLRNGHRNDGLEIIDPREEIRSLERKVDGEVSSYELLEQTKLMGFDERTIKTVLKRKYETTDNGVSRLEILVESIFANIAAFIDMEHLVGRYEDNLMCDYSNPRDG